MSRRVEFQGKVQEFPDDATDAEIEAALGGKPKDLVGRAKEFLTQEPTEPRKDYLGLGGPDLGKHVRTAGKFMLPESWGGLARDVAMSAVPVSSFLKPGSRFLAPAIERTAYAGAQPILESGDYQQGGKQAASVAALEILMGMLGLAHGLPGKAKGMMQQIGSPPPVAVHQAAVPPPLPLGPGGGPQPPIIFQRVNSSSTPSVISGGTMGAVTPNTVTVKPPLSGAWSQSHRAPAAILQESMPRPPLPPMPEFPSSGIKALTDIVGAEQPEQFGLPVGIGALTKIKELSNIFQKAAPLIQ